MISCVSSFLLFFLICCFTSDNDCWAWNFSRHASHAPRGPNGNNPYSFSRFGGLNTGSLKPFRKGTKLRDKKQAQDEGHSQEEPSPANKRRKRSLIEVAWATVKTTSVLFAVRVVLVLRAEQVVLPQLPQRMLMFLLETCMHEKARPKVLRIVAMELENRIQNEIFQYTQKRDYEFGDLTKATLAKFTGKPEYQFGDITKTAISKFTGKPADEYEFGDLTRAMVSKVTGKSEYEFGDISRAMMAKIIGRESYKYGDLTTQLLLNQKQKQQQTIGSGVDSSFDDQLKELREKLG